MTHASPPRRRRFGAWTGAMLTIASMIGTGVFTTTGLLLADLPSGPAVLACWAVGGALALAGALSYAELSAALPDNGGEFWLLSRIFHPAVGFAAGVVSLIVGFSAPIAASAIALALYLERVFPGAPTMPIAAGTVVALSVLHAWRVTAGGRFQVFVTAAKVVLILALIGIGLWLGDRGVEASGGSVDSARAVLSPEFAVGLVLVSFAYTGWNASVYIAGEIDRPRRNILRSLAVGTVTVTVLYVGLNLAFLSAAPVSELAGVVEVGHVAATHWFGPAGGRMLSAVIALGLVSTISAYTMSGPRVYEAMGRAFPRLAVLTGRGRDGRRGPVAAIALQAAVALTMLATSGFEALLTYVGFTLSAFAGLTVAGLIVLRIREPELERPYRVWGYPVTPLAFIALMGWMIGNAIVREPAVTLAGLGTVILGLAAYLALGRSSGAPG